MAQSQKKDSTIEYHLNLVDRYLINFKVPEKIQSDIRSYLEIIPSIIQLQCHYHSFLNLLSRNQNEDVNRFVYFSTLNECKFSVGMSENESKFLISRIKLILVIP